MNTENRPRRRRAFFIVSYVVVVASLFAFAAWRVVDERAKDAARPAVCASVAEVYRAAADGQGGLDDEAWNAHVDQVVGEATGRGEAFDLGARARTLRDAVRNEMPTRVRLAVKSVGCPPETFPPILAMALDATPVTDIRVAAPSNVSPLIVKVPGLHQPPATSVSDTVTGLDLADLAALGVPVDKIPLIDADQARIAYVGAANDGHALDTVLRFATVLDDYDAAMKALADSVAALPDMTGAVVPADPGLAALLWSANRKVSFQIYIWRDELPGGVDVIEVKRHDRNPVPFECPPAMESLARYATANLTGMHPTVGMWWVGMGTDEYGELSAMSIQVTIPQPVEPVMDAIATVIGADKADGSHLAAKSIRDSTMPQMRWKVLTHIHPHTADVWVIDDEPSL